MRPPVNVDLDVAALRPAELLQLVPERGNAGPSFRVALGVGHQRADPPHPLALLRARRERPSRRAAEECNEVAPSHARLPVAYKAYQRAALCVTTK